VFALAAEGLTDVGVRNISRATDNLAEKVMGSVSRFGVGQMAGGDHRQRPAQTVSAEG
jgi:hypothetical protein